MAAIKLLPTPDQAQSLIATLAHCNAACNWLSSVAWKRKAFRQFDLHKVAYFEAKAKFGLTAQAVIRSIAKVADAYKLDRKTQRVFRPDAAQPYDERIIRFTKDGTVNLWTIDGRQTIAMVMGEHQRRLMAYRKGEVDLCRVRGKWYLAATCDVPETEEFEAEDWLGVDLGIVSLAADSDGTIHSGANVERIRSKLARRKAGLQRRGTKAAKRCLRRLAGKERRFRTHTNHCISKAIVLTAERTGRGIALEDLTHIRSRVTARRGQRSRLHSWAFGQARAFLSYKAKRAGVPLLCVNPRNTSRECAVCGCIDKRNRVDQATFLCIRCGHEAHADFNAAVNIRSRALATRAAVIQPEVLAA